MYHEIKTYKVGKDVITPYEFESDLKYLQKNKYSTLTMTQLIEYVNDDVPLPDNPIILTFDDGYLNTYLNAFPLLKEYHMKIVFSIIGKNTDDFTRIPDNNADYSHVTWNQLNEMLDSGYVEVQNHTYNLHSLNNKRVGCMQTSAESFTQYEKILTEDIGKFQEQLTMMTGDTPNTFAYPYGRFNANTDLILKNLGFQATLSCQYGINRITKEPDSLFDLKRICRAHGQSLENVLKEALKTVEK